MSLQELYFIRRLLKDYCYLDHFRDLVYFTAQLLVVAA